MKVPLTKINEDSLINLLNKSTEKKDVSNQESISQININDFDNNLLEKEKIIEEKKLNEEKIFEQNQDSIIEETQAPPKVDKIDYNLQAEMLLMSFDGIQTLSLPPIYHKAIFNQKDKETLKIWKKQGKPEKNVMNSEDKELESKKIDYDNLVDELPLTPTEINTIRNPLAIVLSKYQYKTSPEMLLLGAVFSVMASRLIPIFSSNK